MAGGPEMGIVSMWKWANAGRNFQLVLCKQLPSSLGFSVTPAIMLAQTRIQEAILKCCNLGEHTVHAMFYRKQMNPCFQQYNPTQITVWSFKWCLYISFLITSQFASIMKSKKGREKETSLKSQEINRKYCLGRKLLNVSIRIRTHAVPVLCNYQKIETVGMGGKYEVGITHDERHNV